MTKWITYIFNKNEFPFLFLKNRTVSRDRSTLTLSVYSFLFFLFFFSGCESSMDSTDLTHLPFVPTDYHLETPEHFGKMSIPIDNPMTVEGVELGRRLFFDPILSVDSTMACASCHIPDASFTDYKAVSIGFNGSEGKRSSMSLLNVGFYDKGLFWDGRVKTLEEQALIPVEDPIELHENWSNVEQKLRRHSQYPTYFRSAFGIKNKTEITKTLAVKAIAQFERTLVSSGNSRFDQFLKGEIEFTEDEQMGYDLFFDVTPAVKDAECGNCHNAPLLTNNDYTNNGLDAIADLSKFKDLGRGGVLNSIYENGKFRVPSLINIELTAPYMHDGRFQTLDEVIDHYNSGGHPSKTIHSLIRPLNLTKKEKNQLLAFLKTLTDRTFVKHQPFQTPF